MYIQTDFSLDLALKFCLPHPLNSIDLFSHSIYHFLNVSVKEIKKKHCRRFHTSELSTTSFVKMYNFFLLKFLFSQILCCVPSLSCGCPALGPGRLRVLHWHPSPFAVLISSPLPPHSLSCHGLSIAWNASSHCYLSAWAAFCWRHMERHSFSLRGDQADKALGANSPQ